MLEVSRSLRQGECGGSWMLVMTDMVSGWSKYTLEFPHRPSGWRSLCDGTGCLVPTGSW